MLGCSIFQNFIHFFNEKFETYKKKYYLFLQSRRFVTTSINVQQMIFIFKLQIHGVSECIILGTPMTIGTGLFKLLYKFNDSKLGTVKRRPLLANPEFNLQF